MQIQRIQDNNYNTGFKAKLSLSGYIDDIALSEIEKLKTKALSIGTAKDSINLHLMVPKASDVRRGGKSICPVAWRDINATTNINNEIVHCNEPIGYIAEYKTSHLSLTLNTIKKYLDSLNK